MSIAPAIASRPTACDAFAEVLAYPFASPAAAAAACSSLLRGRSDDDAAELLDAFAALAGQEPLGTLQEGYTRLFDLDTMSRSEPTCYPYVGHYLFDDSHKRGAFILGLMRRFRAAGFEDPSDLPDHLLVVLRFLAVCDDATLSDELVDDAVIPALERMRQLASAADGDGNGDGSPIRTGYLGVLYALELFLRAERPPREPEPLTAEIEREWARNRDSLGIDRAGCGH